MARVTVEDCLEQIPNRFTLVTLVAKRVRQLLSGDQPLVEARNKHVVNALREVVAGHVDLDISQDEMDNKLESLLKKEENSKASS